MHPLSKRLGYMKNENSTGRLPAPNQGNQMNDRLKEIFEGFAEAYRMGRKVNDDAERMVRSSIAPTEKSEAIDDTILDLFGKDRKETIRSGKCMTCGFDEVTEDSFKDAVSLKEYSISGMCQYCQDACFG